MTISNLPRYWHTMRYLYPGQVCWRVWHRLRLRLGFHRIPKIRQTPQPARDRLRALRALLELCRKHHIQGLHDIDALRRQSFSFLNHPVEDLGYIPWSDATLPRLWRYHLHGFGYLRDFAINALGEKYLGDRDRLLHWMRDWMEKHPVGADVAWDAYTVSERLINWALAMAVFEIQEGDILTAYARQARWLMWRLEYDLRANHLMKNAAALAAAALVLDDQALCRRAAPLLEQELREQILEDGGHYERSPMYHAQILWDLLVVYVLSPEPPEHLQNTIARMTCFLERICHPDGDIPLFGDAALRVAPKPRALSGVARDLLPVAAFVDLDKQFSQDGTSLRASGFFEIGDLARERRFLVKTAPPSPDWQPGHSHADMLSYELCLGPQRIVVDSGVHGYAESPYRDYCRGGSAHNIAQLGSLEQCELWGVFRVARRSQAVEPVFESREDGALLVCGYAHYSGYRHMRRIQYFKHKGCWEVQDLFETLPEQAPLSNYIHLHPECTVEREGEGVVVMAGEQKLFIEALTGETMTLHRGESLDAPYRYCPEFGLALPAPALVLHKPPPATTSAYRIRLVSDWP